jgi:sulfatase maturation enzyme AslB (radical SAM superfamily)
MNIVVSIDGLQPKHDVRRAPGTYGRILKNIAGQQITIHCTITGPMMKQPGYLMKFLQYWSHKPEIRRVWLTKVVPCQFGGNSDCASCGCVALMGLAAIAEHKLGGIIPVRAIFKASVRIGQIGQFPLNVLRMSCTRASTARASARM